MKTTRELCEAYRTTDNPVTRSSYREILVKKVPELVRDQELLEELLEEMRLMTDIPDTEVHSWVAEMLKRVDKARGRG